MPNSLHRSAIASPASHKLHPLVQRRTLLPRHNHSLPEGRKCYLCVRYDVLPMSPAAHSLSLMHLRCYAAAVSVSEFVAQVAQTTPVEVEFKGNSKPSPTFSAHC